MRNVDLRSARATSLPLPRGARIAPRGVRVCALPAGGSRVYALTTAGDGCAPALLCANVGADAGAQPPPPWPPCDLARFLATPADAPSALDADAAGLDAPVVALRGGALVSVDAETGAAELVGDVEDEDGVEERGGVLALAKSPDGALVALASPVKIIVLTAAWEPLAEVEVVDGEGRVRVAVEAHVSWRGDGACFAVCMRDAAGDAYARIVDREGDGVVRAEVEEVQAAASAAFSAAAAAASDPAARNEGDDDAAFGRAVAWQPRVGGILCVAGPGRAVSAFERNGLRHLRNDFELHADGGAEGAATGAGLPLMLEWSCDSSMLAVACHGQRAREEQVDIYVRSNYRWYRKQCLRLAHGETVADVRWDADDRTLVHVTSCAGELMSFGLRSSHVGAVSRNGLACVIDGRDLLVTNLPEALVPPPMYQRILHAPDAIVAVAHDEHQRIGNASRRGVTLLLASGKFARLPMEGVATEGASSTAICEDVSADALTWTAVNAKGTVRKTTRLRRFPVCVTDDIVAVVETEGAGINDCIALFHLCPDTGEAQMFATCEASGHVRALSLAPRSCVGEIEEGRILVAALSTGSVLRILVRGALSTPQLCVIEVLDSIECKAARDALSVDEIVVSCGDSVHRIVVVHDESGCLEAVDLLSKTAVQLSTECTSFCVSRGHLAYTTRSHVLHCLPLLSPSKLVLEGGNANGYQSHFLPHSADAGMTSLMSQLGLEAQRFDIASASSQPPSTTEGMVRPIDRASVIVCALPNDVRIVLQAPRGNIETIAPRPLVLAEVWRLASAKEYGAAFRLSRQQRVDMNIMVEAEPEEFLRHIPLLIQEVPVASHLSVFLTYLRGGRERINAVCDGVVAAIDAVKDQQLALRLNSAVLTALVVRQPPLYGEGLRRVEQSYQRSEEEGRSALDFLLVLSKNEEMLYNEALGAYDLKLALMVAKASQLDPVDYSNELRGLRAMSEQRRRYTIDLKLGRYSTALCNLFECGPSERGACLELAREHHLYPAALHLFTSDLAACSLLRSWYGSHLLSQELYADAAIIYVANGNMRSAARAYRDGGYWRMAISSFPTEGPLDGTNEVSDRTRDSEEYTDLETWHQFAESVADFLSERGESVDAATVRWEMLHDLDGAVDELVSTQQWLSAFQLLAAAESWRGSRINPNRRGTDLLGSQNGLGYRGTGDEDGDYFTSTSVSSCRSRILSELEVAADGHVKDLNDNASKLKERTDRLAAVRETKHRMLKALGVPGGGGNGEDADSDAFSSSTGVSSLGSFGSDMTFASSTATERTQTSLYHSIGRGSGGVGGIKQQQAERRRATKAARKRVRTGHPREEEALVATLKRLVPNSFLRARVGLTITALSHSGKQALAASLQAALISVYSRCRALPDDVLALDVVQGALVDESWLIPVLNALHHSSTEPAP